MSQELRIEAAARAAAKDEDASNWDDEPEYYRNGWCNRMAVGIEAADAALFSDEAVEVAEELLREKFCVDENMGEFDATAVWGTPADIVATVVAALKGDA